MRSAEAVGFLGRPIEDLYGRQVGVVVGFSLKTDGDIDSLGVDEGSGSFREIASGRLIVYDRALVVVPAWKVELMRTTEQKEVLRKRLLALDEMGGEAERGAKAQLDQLRIQYRSRLVKLQESCERLLQDIDSRMDEIAQQDEAVARFLIEVKVQFGSGEIDEESFSKVTAKCGSMKTKNTMEFDELSAARKTLLQDAEPKGREQKAEVSRPTPRLREKN